MKKGIPLVRKSGVPQNILFKKGMPLARKSGIILNFFKKVIRVARSVVMQQVFLKERSENPSVNQSNALKYEKSKRERRFFEEVEVIYVMVN